MGCSHYEAWADQAVADKKKLEEEKEKYSNIKSDIDSIKGSIDNYSDFFKQLGEALAKVIVNGKPFDEDKCKNTSESIKQHGYKISEISSALHKAIQEIDKEIEDKQIIINQRWMICRTCATPPEEE